MQFYDIGVWIPIVVIEENSNLHKASMVKYNTKNILICRASVLKIDIYGSSNGAWLGDNEINI